MRQVCKHYLFARYNCHSVSELLIFHKCLTKKNRKQVASFTTELSLNTIMSQGNHNILKEWNIKHILPNFDLGVTVSDLF